MFDVRWDGGSRPSGIVSICLALLEHTLFRAWLISISYFPNIIISKWLEYLYFQRCWTYDCKTLYTLLG